MMTRRSVVAAAAALTLRPARAAEPLSGLSAGLARIEAESGGRLGVALLDTGSGARGGHRADERFPLCSTFKVLAAGAVLSRVDAGRENIDRLVTIVPSDLVANSPVTKQHVGPGGLSLAELCEAAITLSDNTAGNLLLAAIDGPAGLTAYLRALGDPVTRLDRTEPELNEALPGDPRDTTTPAAMLDTLNRLLLGDALKPASRKRLVAWLLASRTGDKRLRAGLPQDWRAGDKTGTGDRGTTNDVALIWPPRGAPVLITAYLTGTEADADARSATIAQVGKACAVALAR